MTERIRYILVALIVAATYGACILGWWYFGLDPAGAWSEDTWNAAMATRKQIAAGIFLVATALAAWVLLREE